MNIRRARRRDTMRSALLLTLGATWLLTMTRMVISLNSMGRYWFTRGVVVEAVAALLAFGGGAYLGLCRLNGEGRGIVPMRALSRAQVLWLCLTGATLVFPVTLLSDLIGYLSGAGYLVQGEKFSAFMDGMRADFLPRLLKSALLVPVLEEVFFRGYLQQTLKGCGEKRVMLAVSLCFALTHSSALHSMDGSLAIYTLLGVLFTLVMRRTQSIAAAILVHGWYNLSLLLCDYSGLDVLFYGFTLPNCALRLALCAAFVYALKRAWTARKGAGQLILWEGGKPSRREIALYALATALVILSAFMGE